MYKYSIIYHSRFHSVEKIAKEIAKGITLYNNVKVSMIDCTKTKEQINEINESNTIIFGSPTYFGSLSSEMKEFFDSTGEIFFKRLWQNKIAAAFTHSSSPSGDKLMTLNQMMVFAMQQGMLWVGQNLLTSQSYEIPKEWSDLGSGSMEVNVLGSWSGLMVQSDTRRGIEISKSDMLTARLFGKRIAEITKAIEN